jgi:glycosyltransferase involved in cell wall biosynthesis
MRSIISGTARNIEHCWNSTQRSLESLISALDDYVIVIIESNSTDNTISLLKEWCLQDSRRIIISLGNLTEQSRTKRIAYCRNSYMNFLRTQKYFEIFEFMIVIDLDNALQIEDDIKGQLESSFSRDDWDAIASNRRGRYYDVWALRSKELGCNFDCWEMIDKQIQFHNGQLLLTRRDRIQMFVKRFQQTIDSWISCESAFGGMVIYRTSKVKDRIYDGSITCEHVSFNNGLRMLINPALMSGGECIEHLA